MKSILLVSPAFYSGGAEKQYRRLVHVVCDSFPSRNISVFVMTEEDAAFEHFSWELAGYDNVTVVRFLKKKLTRVSKIEVILANIWLFFKVWHKKTNIVYFYSLYLCPSVSLLPRVGRRIYSERIFSPMLMKRRCVYFWVSKRVNQIVVNSKPLFRFFRRYYESDVRLINNFVTQAVWQKESSKRRCAKKVFAIVARISPEKNIEYVIESLSHQNVILNLYYSSKNVRYHAYLVSCAKNVTNLSINFMGERDLVEIFRESDAVILPSRYEGTPNIAIECFASNVPIFLSKTSHHQSLGVSESFLFSLSDFGEELIQKLSGWGKFSDKKKLRLLESNRALASRYTENAFKKAIVKLFSE